MKSVIYFLHYTGSLAIYFRADCFLIYKQILILSSLRSCYIENFSFNYQAFHITCALVSAMVPPFWVSSWGGSMVLGDSSESFLIAKPSQANFLIRKLILFLPTVVLHSSLNPSHPAQWVHIQKDVLRSCILCTFSYVGRKLDLSDQCTRAVFTMGQLQIALQTSLHQISNSECQLGLSKMCPRQPKFIYMEDDTKTSCTGLNG